MNFVEYNLLSKRMVSSTWNFCDSDSEELYNKNLVDKPADWFYRNNPITYNFNSLGFRFPEISDINFDDYILFLGDSHVEGVGLHLEHTFAYLVSQKLNKSYVNLGIGGSGLDTMFYNLVTWISKFPLPKYVVLFWSDPARCITKNFSENRFQHLCIHNHHVSENENYNKFLVLGDLIGFFDSRVILYNNMINDLLTRHNIFYKNISNLNFNKDLTYPIEQIVENKMERARDVHVGLEWHQVVCDILAQDYLDKYINARDNQDIRGQK